MDRKIKNKYERFYFVSMILSQEGRKEYVGIVSIWARLETFGTYITIVGKLLSELILAFLNELVSMMWYYSSF